MGEAKRRKLLGLPTQRAIPAQTLIDRIRELPKPEHEKWGKTLIVHDAEGNRIPPDKVAQEMRKAGKTNEEVEAVVSAMLRPWPSPELNAVPSWYDDRQRKSPELEEYRADRIADFLNKPLTSYEDMASEEYDPVAAAAPYRGQRSYGRKNVYACDNGHETVTVDTAEGVTPFMIVCPECSEYARSKMYRVDQTLEASHEWYRPDTLDGISPHNHDHVKRGGLIMRKIDGNEPEQAAKH